MFFLSKDEHDIVSRVIPLQHKRTRVLIFSLMIRFLFGSIMRLSKIYKAKSHEYNRRYCETLPTL